MKEKFTKKRFRRKGKDYVKGQVRGEQKKQVKRALIRSGTTGAGLVKFGAKVGKIAPFATLGIWGAMELIDHIKKKKRKVGKKPRKDKITEDVERDFEDIESSPTKRLTEKDFMRDFIRGNHGN